MSERITQRDLEAVCRRINRTVNGTDETPCWTRRYEPGDPPNGANVASIGVYYIDGAYGGVALYRIVTDGGGVQDVFGNGHLAKRDLYSRMHGFLVGIEAVRSDG